MMQARTERQVLTLLRRRGATRLRSVTFRSNRSTIWSLTRAGTALNLHVAFRTAPAEIIEQLAVIAREARRGGRAYRRAAAVVSDWEVLDEEMGRIRREHLERRPARQRKRGPSGPDCSTPGQRLYLKRLYHYLNHSRFDDRLPNDLTIRLSNRMTTGFGQFVPGLAKGVRYIAEIALNVDLMLEGNGRERMDTLVHEMAHGADWLFNGALGHGPSWRRWARYAGCREEALAGQPIRRRPSGATNVGRVPKLPPAARRMVVRSRSKDLAIQMSLFP